MKIEGKMTMAKKILVTVPFTAEQREALQQAATAYGDKMTFAEAPESLAPYDAIIGNVPAGRLSEAGKLKWLQLNSAGADAYVKPGVLPDGAVLTCATGSYGTAIAEYMVAMLLLMMKKIPAYLAHQQRGEWSDEGPVTTPAGKRILIVGTGDIGLSFARRIAAFALPDHPIQLVGVRRRASVCPEPLDEIHPLSELREQVAQADVIAVALPGTPATYHLFDADMLLAAKKGAYLMNVGRGSVIDNAALLRPEVYEHFAGIWSDVFEQEPLPAGDPLYSVPGLYVTPHITGQFHLDITLENIARIALKNYRAWHGEGAYQSRVDITTGYAD